jgi:Fe-S cluster assembly ATP-binding protein
LEYVAADKGQVLYDGILSCTNNPREILGCIEESGYEECVRCIIKTN